MKTARLINAAIWAAICIALIVGVCSNWIGRDSIAVGVVCYTFCCVCFCLFFDQHIVELYQRKDGIK